MDTSAEAYRNLQFASIEAIRSCTCIVMLDKSSYSYKAHGTGVFIQIQNHYFLVSAAHVMDKHGEFFIFLSQEKEIIYPGGDTYINRTENREKDELDIAVLRLDDECLPHIKRSYSFVQAEDLAINHIFQPWEYYAFLGFPASKTKVKYKTDIFCITTLFHFTAPIGAEHYEQLGRNPYVNVIATYNKKHVYNGSKGTYGTGPDLYGISGCGLWFTDPEDMSTGIIKPKLTAIMTDWFAKNKNIIIGTRIDVVTGMIKKFLDIDFPDSSIVMVN
ncbi:hypothetical protein HNP37_001861 [Flavobacterium nitrogenifigens]|uniref:Trypsin-like peptidase domain-containing protein n=2 Tax=Flavobacterium TaxID=237 RepID=A0A7W7N6G7_9FLAO|nr:MULTISPECIES: hypothetical protein [Flavobacterium]MBB4801800.1 hypothetical protein [Flavobacterium nitrogenifigens]MBB6386758.1 hypothetical protein [Flavobacterium notoginsengisoli]